MEHPPKQGLKHPVSEYRCGTEPVLMEHPPKQGLKPIKKFFFDTKTNCFNGTSTKTRIETLSPEREQFLQSRFNGTSTKTRIETQTTRRDASHMRNVLMEHPPKQGLKQAFDNV